MLMNEKDLIQAKAATQKLVCKTIKQFGITMITLILCSMFASVFLPSIMPNIASLFIIVFGVMFGMMMGAMRAYNIFWEKTDFENSEAKAMVKRNA